MHSGGDWRENWNGSSCAEGACLANGHACDNRWTADFSLDVLGVPNDESLTLVSSRLVGHGSLVFCKQPGAGRQSDSSSGTILHRDTHLLGRLLREERLAWKVPRGTYAKGAKGSESVTLAVVVTISGDRDCKAGAKGLITFTEDNLAGNLGPQPVIRTAVCGLQHKHLYDSPPNVEKLKIELKQG